jgi:Zn-dependent protease
MSRSSIATGSTGTGARETTRWPLERVLFAMAGSVVLLSVLLAVTASPWFLLLTAFVGVNQWLFVLFGACPASLVLRHFGVAAQCRW